MGILPLTLIGAYTQFTALAYAISARQTNIEQSRAKQSKSLFAKFVIAEVHLEKHTASALAEEQSRAATRISST